MVKKISLMIHSSEIIFQVFIVKLTKNIGCDLEDLPKMNAQEFLSRKRVDISRRRMYNKLGNLQIS